MIYTVTLNPALDRTIWVKQIKQDDTNRIEKEERYAGGKGIDVSRVLRKLGINGKALGFVGGFTGQELEGRMLNQGIGCDFVRISGETRTNIIVNEMSTGHQISFSGRGPEIQPYELMQLIRKIEEIDNLEYMVISGSLPPGVHPEIYRKIIEMAKGKGARVILDTDGESLRVGILASPDVIKPNIHELGRLVDAELKETSEVIEAARKIQEQGVEIALVSMGARGILLVSATEQWLATPPKVEVVNTIGAGDSAVAGFVYGLVEGKPLKESLALAVAAGTATTLRPGTALCERDDALRLVPEVEVSAI
ncbi:MAG: 1-phosphofructokinase [Chloroflexi bacterium]|nr:1-phosphofructokinase [Chloroflexota bacterium]